MQIYYFFYKFKKFDLSRNKMCTYFETERVYISEYEQVGTHRRLKRQKLQAHLPQIKPQRRHTRGCKLMHPQLQL
jgi:hypothetical protein